MAKNIDYQKACLYDTEWQALRVSLLSKYNTYGGFGTIQGVEMNLGKLYTYLRAAEQGSNEYIRRAWRITNLLNATLMGYGSKEEFKDHALAVRLRQGIYSLIHKKHADEWLFLNQLDWNWPEERRKLKVLHQHSPDEFTRIWDNLIGRKLKTEKKDMMHNRPELQKYLSIMEEIRGQ